MNSTQLELALFTGEPWEGKSPRALTKVALGLIFKPGGAKKRERFAFDDRQIEMFPEAIKEPRQYGGAPSLLPLPRRVQ